ncbi:protein SOSEKI 5 [Impatiens glandulifera]|uniref:protein SOSEKI 5 n=1 Tax=Impatiens glandulifera TaxID=253017 RepID=UPI001FB0C591|nr:protein SOSEKI 5 [Impatiens glandulifera]
MAIASSRGRSQIQTHREDTSPDHDDDDRTNLPKLPLVYYLTRNGHLEHPHFIEVPLSSPQGLYLRDVINRLVILRGRGMTELYSWSCKRSYRNGFVWHDLEENDLVYPAHGQDYVLKGTELFHGDIISKSNHEIETSARRPPPPPPAVIRKPSISNESDFPVVIRQRNQSWTSTDFNEYKVYKNDMESDSGGGSGRAAAANASTQTEDRRSSRRRTAVTVVEKDEIEEVKTKPPSCSGSQSQSQYTELRREDMISPPESDSSPETLGSLMKGDSRVIVSKDVIPTPPSGRLRASSVLMQLISCGSMSFKDCGPTCWKEEEDRGEERQGFNLISYYKGRVPRGRVVSNKVEKKDETSEINGQVKMEGKEYFSGSLLIVETNKDEIPILKRSASDRSSSTQTWK